ncbi:TRIM66 [Mytilus coruscus]|uniref:TRIM66 n=1 Tax=Mytilus coruscus TaxID=42192 RepID=A0A6J8BHJ8_MYTCO|nr:TRIM66 [Mytilus coruscus]
MYALEMDFTNIKCQDHTGQNCCLFCESCDQLVCPLCISKTHNGHGLIEISEGYEIKLDRLKQAKVKIQSNLQKLNKHSVMIEDQLRYDIDLYRDNKKNVQAQNIALKKAVDQLTEKMDKKVEELYTGEKKSHERAQTKANELKKKSEDQMSMLEDIITAKDAAKIFTGGEKFAQSLIEKVQIPFLISKGELLFYPGKITEEVFGKIGLRKDCVDIERLITRTKVK